MANVKGMTIDIGADTSSFQKALNQLNAPINKLSKSLKEVNDGLKFDYRNPTLVANKMALMSEKIEASEYKVKQLKSAISSLNEVQEKNGYLTEEQQQKMIKLTTQLEKEKYYLNQMKEEYDNIGKSGEISFDLISEKASKLGDKLSSLGTQLTRVSVATVGLFGLVSKDAIEFETAITGVYKTVDGTEKQLSKLTDGIRDMAREIPASTTEIAAVAEAAGQLGIATDDILSFTKVMIDLGNSTNLSAEEAATALAKFANVTKMSSTDYDRLGSTIVALGNNFATTESDIVSMASRLAATGELTGLTESQILAMATAMSSVGIEAEAGGSAMSKLLKQIQVAVEVGGDDLKQFSKVSGMSAKDFQKAFKEDSVKALSAFITGLNDTERNGKSAIAILDDMDIKEVRLSNTILSLANASDLMADAVDLANKSWDENTALSEEANKRYDTLESKIEVAKNKLKDISITLGQKLMPTIEKVIEKVDKFAKYFDTLNEKQVETILKVGALVIALGPMVTVLGKVVSAGGGFVKVIEVVVNSLGVASGKVIATSNSVKILGTVFTALSSPIGLVTTALGLVVAGMVAHEVAVNNEIKSMGGLRDEINSQRESWDLLGETRTKMLDTNLTEISNCETLVKELQKITDENGKVKEGYESRAQVILNDLNQALGTEYSMTDNIINKYDELNSTINKVIATKKAEILLNAYEEEYASALKNQSDATKTLVELREKLTQKTNEYAGASAREKVQLQKEITTLGNGIKEQTQLIDEYGKTIVDYENLQKASVDGSAEDLEKACNNMITSYKQLEKQSNSTVESQLADQIKYVNGLKDALSDAKKQNDTYSQQIIQTQLDSAKEQLSNLKESLKSQTSAIKDLTPEQVQAYKDMASNSLSEYNNVLNSLPADTRKKIEDATGVLTNNTKLQEQFGKIGEQSVSSFDEQASKLPEQVQNYLNRTSSIINEDTTVTSATKELGSNIEWTLKQNNSEAWGKDLVSGMADGIRIQSNSKSFNSVLLGFANKISSYLHFSRPDVGPLREYEKWMPDMIEGLAKSLQKAEPKLINQVLDLSNQMSNALQSELDLSQIDSTINSTGASVNNVSVVVNPQTLNNESLDQAFNYINNRFGLAI